MEKIITAHKDPNVVKVFAFINRRMLSHYFHQIWTSDFEILKTLDRNRPIIFYANHSNWWDGLIAFYLVCDLLKIDGYLMMMARQLRKYRFFRWVGAFSVDRDVPISAFRSLQYAASLLTDRSNNRAVWIFPQGELLPNDIRPINFLRGLEWLIKHVSQPQLVAVSFRYEFLNEQLPEVFITFQITDTKLTSLPAKTIAEELQTTFTQQLNLLRDNVVNQQREHFRPLLKGKTSLNILYEKAVNLIMPGKQNK